LLHLSAISLSSRIAPLLDQAAHGTVIATFGRSCYIDLNGRIIAIVGAELLNGPLNLVASLPSDATLLHLPVGADVAVRRGALEIAGRLEIDTASAQHWTPRVVSMAGADARPAELTRALAFIQTVLDRDAPQESFARAEARPQRATDAMADLAHALRTGDVALAGRAAGNLAGLGPGLTPSGDDVLAGALLAVAVSGPASAPAFRTRIIASIRGRTTRISEAYLDAAADGDAGETWHRLLDLLRNDEGGRLRDAVHQILAFGETSGGDMLAGFVLGMTALGAARAHPT